MKQQCLQQYSQVKQWQWHVNFYISIREIFSLVIRWLVTCLQTAIEGPSYCYTFARKTWITESLFQFLKGTFLLLQLLDQRVHSVLGPFLFFVALFPAEKAFDCRACEWKQTVETAYWRGHCCHNLNNNAKRSIWIHRNGNSFSKWASIT